MLNCQGKKARCAFFLVKLNTVSYAHVCVFDCLVTLRA